jgi:hypothetical protein
LLLLATAIHARTASAQAPSQPEVEVVVSAVRPAKDSVATPIKAEEARHIAGAQGDALKAVQLLPGVARPAFGSGELVVWGAAPTETRVYLDGVEIPALFHFGGVRGILPSDGALSVDIAPGGYGVERGRSLGGAARITTKPIADDGVHAYAALDFLDGSLGITAPIASHARARLAGRIGYLDRLVSAVAPEAGRYTPIPRYADAQARIDLDLRAGEQLSFAWVGASDALERVAPNLDVSEQAKEAQSLLWQRLYARYSRTHDDGSAVTITPFAGWDLRRTSTSATDASAAPTRLDITSRSYGVRALDRERLNRYVVAQAGLDLQGVVARVERQGSLTLPARDGDSAVFGQAPADDASRDVWTTHLLDLAPTLSADIALGPLTVTPGLRLDALVLESTRAVPVVGDAPEIGQSRTLISMDPRLAVRMEASSRLALSSSLGLYHQPPAPEDLSPIFGTPGLTASRAIHLTASVEAKVSPTTTVRLTGFGKRLSDLPFRTRLTPPLVGRALVQDGEGRVAGVEVFAQQRAFHGLSAMVSYTLSRSERRYVGDPSYRVFEGDQPHLVSIAARQKLGRFSVGARFRGASGLPRTLVIGSYFDARHDRYDPVLGEPVTARLPFYYAVDLRAEAHAVLGRAHIEFSLDVLNATNHANTEVMAYDARFSQAAPITGLPLMAVAGVRISTDEDAE